MNRKLSTIFMVVFVALVFVACDGDKKKNNKQQSLSTMEESKGDSTMYGVCGDNTGMHVLELITVQGDTLSYVFDVEDGATVKGGILAGDRLAVVGYKNADGEKEATVVLNLTT